MAPQPPAPAETQAQQQVARDFRWNFTVNALDGASFWFGMSFFSSAIILPLFVSHLTSNPLAIGLIGFLGWAGVLLPQVFTANAVERLPRKKFFPVNLGFFLERLPVLLLPLAVYLLAPGQPLLALIAFFLLYTWHNLGAGVILVGWQDMIAKIIPVEKRGRFFGLTNFVGNGTGILGALAVPFILARFDFPLGYVTCFSITAVFFLLSWVFLSLTREPAVASTKRPVSQAEYLRLLPGVLRRDRNFRRYLLAQVAFALSGMGAGFLAVYSVQAWDLSDSSAGGFTIAMQAGLALANLAFGFLADRRGHKLSLEICWLLSLLSFLLAVIAPTPAWFFLVFFLRGAVSAGTLLSGFSIVYEFTAEPDRPTYIGLANTIPGVAVALAPLLGGWLAGLLGYRWMFLLSLGLGVLGLVLLRFTVREPRQAVPAPAPLGAQGDPGTLRSMADE